LSGRAVMVTGAAGSLAASSAARFWSLPL